jgi:hypothetical protein
VVQPTYQNKWDKWIDFWFYLQAMKVEEVARSQEVGYDESYAFGLLDDSIP